MKKIFITGGAGYVGSSLVPKLLKKGYKITVLDLMIYGDNVLSKNENLTSVKGDIRDQVLINKKDEYDPSFAFSNWAFGIARWQVLAYYKKSKRAIPMLSLDISEEINPDWLNDVPFSNLIRKERQQLIKGLNHILSKRQKEIFNLLLQDFTNIEIANTIGTTPNNVQSTKSRLIERIKKFVTNNKDEKYHNY